jgi:hypothetical protein
LFLKVFMQKPFGPISDFQLQLEKAGLELSQGWS